MMRDGKIFRILSAAPVEVEILEFDNAIQNDEYVDYVDFLEMSLPNQINL
jgi:hypothetical protein